MSEVLRISALTKSYGKFLAVDNLNLNIRAGQVFGMLGPNGSGKTTTLGMILDVVIPTSGSFEWFGGIDCVAARRKIGCTLETPCFYGYLTAVQNLKIVAHIKECGIDNIDETLRRVNLYERRHDKFKTYSLGMKQRLSIAAALLSNPSVLILDEPTNGLDPEGIAEIRVLIKDIANQGKTVILASHLLDEVQKVCTHFCILEKGIKIYEGSVSDIPGETNEVEIASDNPEILKSTISTYSAVESLRSEKESIYVTLKEGYFARDINTYCFEHGIVLNKVVVQTNSLEQEFLRILKEN